MGFKQKIINRSEITLLNLFWCHFLLIRTILINAHVNNDVMSSRAVRRLQRDKDIIVIPDISDDDDDNSLNDTDVRSDKKHKTKKKQKAFNLFAQVVQNYITILRSVNLGVCMGVRTWAMSYTDNDGVMLNSGHLLMRLPDTYLSSTSVEVLRGNVLYLWRPCIMVGAHVVGVLIIGFLVSILLCHHHC